MTFRPKLSQLGQPGPPPRAPSRSEKANFGHSNDCCTSSKWSLRGVSMLSAEVFGHRLMVQSEKLHWPLTQKVCWLVGSKCVIGNLSQINIRQLQTVLNIKIDQYKQLFNQQKSPGTLPEASDQKKKKSKILTFSSGRTPLPTYQRFKNMAQARMDLVRTWIGHKKAQNN